MEMYLNFTIFWDVTSCLVEMYRVQESLDVTSCSLLKVYRTPKSLDVTSCSLLKVYRTRKSLGCDVISDRNLPTNFDQTT